MNRKSKEDKIIGPNGEGKKSVEDLLVGTQAINQAITTTYSNFTSSNLQLSSSSSSTTNHHQQQQQQSSLSLSAGSGESSSASVVDGKSSSPSSSPRCSPKFPLKSASISSSNSGNKIIIDSIEKIENTVDNFLTKTSKIESTVDNLLNKTNSSGGCGSQQQQQNSNNELQQNIKLPLQEGDKSTKPISKISDRAKKKSWYNVLYPSYKSRSEDFKKLFKDVPDDERLVVDYSCAVQRDILVHGRLYVSQNYLCFYANIFRWETCLCIKWKDVTSITKDKTARVIPNAISISAGNDKYFFTSFTTRDKAYLMLFRVWQNALMDKQMQPQEMWQWVHNCYGDELGLTSDDEDYIDPYLVTSEATEASTITTSESIAIPHSTNQRGETDYNHKNKSSLETSSEDQNCSSLNDNSISTIIDNMGGINNISPSEMNSRIRNSRNDKSSSDGQQNDDRNKLQPPTESKKKLITTKNNRQGKETEQIPTDMSDSSDSDQNKNVPFISTAECTSMHEGRQLVHTILPINIDSLFNLLFSKSKFFVDFHTLRKSTDLYFGDWVVNSDNVKTRTFKVTVVLTPAVGPKTAQVTETQVLRECSQPGELYSIDVSSANAGIPYADSFCVDIHYCLVRTIDDHTMLSVHTQIKYKKSVWGVVKGFIEKNTWAGLEDFYSALLRALQSEYCIPPAKAKCRRPRKNAANSRTNAITASQDEPTIINALPINQDAIKITNASTNSVSTQFLLSEPKSKYKWLSWFVIGLLTALILLNVVLLFKLWKLENNRSLSISQTENILTMKNLPKSHKDWIELLKHQEALHENEMKKWQIVLQTAIELLRKVSIVCKTIIDSGNLTEFISNIHNEL